MPDSMEFRASGKLLISGEYLVLDGAKSWAMPTKKGQKMSVKLSNADKRSIHWMSYSETGSLWFECRFGRNLNVLTATDFDVAERLKNMLVALVGLNPEFLLDKQHVEVRTELEFNRDWGFGTSSTLISMLAQWAEINPYRLLDLAFSGSGYDIACAKAKESLLYRRVTGNPEVESFSFKPSFGQSLWLVYLDKKQISRDEIARYDSLNFDREKAVYEVNGITDELLASNSLSQFESAIREHESLLSGILGRPTIKSLLFPDFRGEVKSLGAWGGDFVLVTSDVDPTPYFQSKDFQTVLPLISEVNC